MDPIIIASIVVGSILLIALVVVIILLVKKKNKTPHIKVDEEFMNNLISYLGGKENIKEVSIDNARLKFLVDDLEKTDLNGLKTISENGVFVTGNIIKTLFKYDSFTIKKALEKYL